jgi:hypothetical protein
MAVNHAAGRGGLAGVGARIVLWRQLAIRIVNVSDPPPSAAERCGRPASSAATRATSAPLPSGWMGSLSATGWPRIEPSNLDQDENWLASHIGGGRWNCWCRACTAFQTSSTCDVGTAKQTKSHVIAFSVVSYIGRTAPSALRATSHMTTRRHARQ